VEALTGTGGAGEDTGDERAGQALALLALVAGQDVEPAEGSDGTDGRWRIARKPRGHGCVPAGGQWGYLYRSVAVGRIVRALLDFIGGHVKSRTRRPRR
jgi:hypothetical protein